MQRDLSSLDDDAKKYGGNISSDRFELARGANKIRVLTFPVIIATHFFGKGQPAVVCVGIDEGCVFHGDKAPKDEKTGNPKAPSLKLVVYIIDRRDEKIKLAELPLSVRYGIQALQDTEGFEFADFPMPYDIQVFSDPDNKDPKAKYRTTGIPTRMGPISEDEHARFDESMGRITPEQYVEKRKAKVRGTDVVPTREDTREVPPPVEYPEEDINPDDIPF